MREYEAARRLVKSAPELWAVCSEAPLLARHLARFGEITITRLEPENTVAWEGETASGTVSIEPAGWGTRVTLTVRVPAPQEAPAPEPVSPGRRGARQRLVSLVESFLRGRGLLAPAPRPPAAAEAAGVEAVTPPDGGSAPAEANEDVAVALEQVLDSLGSAHHRPYSRA
jgi:hypothetical protein